MVPALIVHGGAGGDPDDKPTYRAALGDALGQGWAILRRGGSALDAIEADRPGDGGPPALERRLRLGPHGPGHGGVRRVHHGRRRAPGRRGRRGQRRQEPDRARAADHRGRPPHPPRRRRRADVRARAGSAALLARRLGDRPAAPAPGSHLAAERRRARPRSSAARSAPWRSTSTASSWPAPRPAATPASGPDVSATPP